MPAFLLQPQIMAKLWLIQIKDSIPREHLIHFVDWLHTPFLNGQVVEEKKLDFCTADRELLDQLVGTIRQVVSALIVKVGDALQFSAFPPYANASQCHSEWKSSSRPRHPETSTHSLARRQTVSLCRTVISWSKMSRLGKSSRCEAAASINTIMAKANKESNCVDGTWQARRRSGETMAMAW
jgi:hypothetical protein